MKARLAAQEEARKEMEGKKALKKQSRRQGARAPAQKPGKARKHQPNRGLLSRIKSLFHKKGKKTP